jgi:hypothetical protein
MSYERVACDAIIRVSQQLDYLIKLLERDQLVELDTEDVLRSEVARCSGCGRFAWDTNTIGMKCDFPQPNGHHCRGIFVANAPRRTTG